MTEQGKVRLKKMFEITNSVELTISDANDNFVKNVNCSSYEEAKAEIEFWEQEHNVYF